MYDAYVENLKLRDGLAQISQRQYSDLMLEVQLCLPSAPNAEGKRVLPRPMRLLDWIEAILIHGKCESALARMRDAFDPSYPDRVPVPAAMRRSILLGEIYHQQCRWQESNMELDAVRRAQVILERNDWSFSREVMRALMTNVNNSILGNETGQATGYEQIADELWESKPHNLTDNLTEARYYYIKARCAAVVAMRILHEWRVHGGGIPSEAEESLANFETYHNRSNSMYTRAGSYRNLVELLPEAVTVYYMIGSESYLEYARELLRQRSEKFNSVSDMRKVPRLTLLVEKFRVTTPQLPRSASETAMLGRQMERLSDLMGTGAESPYYYADFLSISCVYDQWLGQPNKGKVAAVRETLASIGRLDRFTALESALRLLPDDIQGYMNAFGYLFLP
jgi:hypothetical protein